LVIYKQSSFLNKKVSIDTTTRLQEF